jgi:RNA polymerase sigma-B factor
VHDRSADLVDDHDELRRLLDALPERERTIVYLRFFEGLTQSQIATQVGVSQMHVSRLLQRSLIKLREVARETGISAPDAVAVTDEAAVAGDVAMLADEY